MFLVDGYWIIVLTTNLIPGRCRSLGGLVNWNYEINLTRQIGRVYTIMNLFLILMSNFYVQY